MSKDNQKQSTEPEENADKNANAHAAHQTDKVDKAEKKDENIEKAKGFFDDNKTTVIGIAVAALAALFTGSGFLALLGLAAVFFIGGANDKGGVISKNFPSIFDKKTTGDNKGLESASTSVAPSVSQTTPETAALPAAAQSTNSAPAAASVSNNSTKNTTIILDKNGKNIANMQPDALVMEINNSGQVIKYSVLDSSGNWPLDNEGKVKIQNSDGGFTLYEKDGKKYINFDEANSQRTISDLRKSWEKENSFLGSLGSIVNGLFGNAATKDKIENPNMKVAELPAAMEVINQKIDVSNGYLLVKRSDASGKNTVNDLQIMLSGNGEIISFNKADEKGNFIRENDRRFTPDSANKDGALSLKVSHEDGKVFIDTTDENNRQVFAKLKALSGNIKTSMIKPENSGSIDGFHHGITIDLAGLGNVGLSAS